MLAIFKKWTAWLFAWLSSFFCSIKGEPVMSALSVEVPFPVFYDRSGEPLENGYVWIGQANLNPQTNPIQVYFDKNLTQPAAQPLRTLAGYIVNAGTPAQIYVDATNFSILVQDKNGTMVYNFPDGTGISPNASGIVYDPAGVGAVPTTVQAKLRETVSLLDFGADPTGTNDCTSALINAIAAAKAAGINAVNCSGGKWRIDAGGIVLNNVSLYAESPPDFAATYGDTGAVFQLTSTSNVPFVLQQGWSICGITFYWPAQNGLASPTVFPPLFTGTYVAAGVMEDITVLNAYDVFRFDLGIAIGDLRFDRCRMYGINRIFHFLQGAPETISITDCFFTPGCFVPAITPNTFLVDHTSSVGEFMRIDVGASSNPSVDGMSISGTLIYGYRYGIRVLSGALNVSSITNNFFDVVSTALSVEGTAVVANTRFLNNYLWSARYNDSTTSHATIVISSSSPVSNLFLSGNDFVHSRGDHLQWNALALTNLQVSGNRFFNWGRTSTGPATSYYAINATSSTMDGVISNNSFKPSSGSIAHDRNGIGVGNAADIAILGNEFDDCVLAVWVINATKVRIIGNTSDGTIGPESFRNNAASGVVQSFANLWDKAPSGFSGFPSFRFGGGNEVFTGAKTQITFGVSVLNTNGGFASSTFTAPATGIYEFTVSINGAGTVGTDVWRLSLEQAGSGSSLFMQFFLSSTTNGANPCTITGIFGLSAGDTVSAFFTRNSGTGNFTTINDGNVNTFSGKRLA
jgi:hypothetical protein